MPQRFLRAGTPDGTLQPAPRGRVGIVSAGRDKAEALATQRRFLQEVAPGVPHVIVVEDVADAQRMPELAEDPDVILHEAPRSTAGLGEARNLAASVAMDLGASLLVHLDAEAVPLPGFLQSYQQALAMGSTGGRWIYKGPITYLAPEDDLSRMSRRRARALIDPQPRRAFPPPGDVMSNEDHHLFQADNFAVTASGWRALGGFCSGYQREVVSDLDFALRARRAGFTMAWVGGAHVLRAPGGIETREEWMAADRELFVRRWGFEPPSDATSHVG